MRESGQTQFVYVDKKCQRSVVQYDSRCFVCGSNTHWSRWHKTGEKGQGFSFNDAATTEIYTAALRGVSDLFKIGRSVTPYGRIGQLHEANGEAYDLIAQAWALEGP